MIELYGNNTYEIDIPNRIRELDDDLLLKLYKKIKPIVTINGIKYLMVDYDL